MFSKKNKEETENFVLELIISIIETKKPKMVIETAIGLSGKHGMAKTGARLYEVLALIEAGKTYVESFYYANMLTDETYSLFSIADEKNGLTREIIKERVEDKSSIKKIENSIKSSMIQPFVLIFLASIAAVFITTRITPILIEFYKGQQIPSILEPYIAANSYPILGFLVLVSLMFGLMSIAMYAIKNKTGKVEMTLYKISTIVKNLKDIGLSYEQTFMQMAEMENDKKLSELYNLIYNEISISPIQDAIAPILDKLPINIAIVLVDKISRNYDTQGWSYVKVEMKQKTFEKIESFSKMLPFLGYVFIFILMLISLTPMGLLAQKALQMAG